jgi:uncharacterized protein (DUF433 family)
LSWKSRIIVDDEILAGKPVILGTRISVELILTLLADGWTNDQLLEDYPMLKKRDIEAALKYAVETLRNTQEAPNMGGRNKNSVSPKWMSSEYARRKLGI